MALLLTADLKAYLGITSSTDDALLLRVRLAAERRVANYLGRVIEQTTYTSELHDADGTSDKLLLKNWPLISVAACTIEGTAVTAGERQADLESATLYRRSATDSTAATNWDAGRLNISVTYDAGYAAIPADIKEAACKQAAYEWRSTRPGGNRLGDRGTVLDAGGSASYLVGPWAPGVLSALEPYRGRAFA